MKKDNVISILLKMLSYSISFLVLIFLILVIVNGMKYFSVEFFTSYPTDGMRNGGIFPAILGSIYMILLSSIFAIPFGIITGVFLAEFSENKLSKIIDLSVTSLSGVPSIVFGLFGLSLFCITLGFGTSLIAGALTLSIMTLPVISSATAEAICAIPVELKESAYALGLKRNEVIFKVLLPAAKKRLITAALIGFGRTIGETAPILLTGAVFYSTSLPKNIFSPVMTLPTHIYYLVAAYGESAKWMAQGTASFLMIFVLGIYLIAFLVGGRRNG
ncbi:phosphate ABC transporter permease PstA [Thermosipho atlanticus]|uniref:Phosphate transport system permease protein PstA n=1 Tax=Thermosipho atlanticus DSM 15807 TaxID=1123380 RepID=A0A1M5TKW8_9BACT|nr:phosphate ABC transporter permease PstA [Thermosipho atlanticus]SHH51310.1 phosphate ABC transporter membrane protein 2, PhoT family [Thermosipho atlanticus DSM 15807]